MASPRLRLGFVSTAHLHLRGPVQSARDCPEIEAVGLAEPDDGLRMFLAREFDGLPVYTSAAELYD
ncbi:MAG TPA: hypothetical protein VFF52_05355 [Isosphaeraceae bacterium]|nr:hypothetical protein [Isosphaeraceae bacterium]